MRSVQAQRKGVLLELRPCHVPGILVQQLLLAMLDIRCRLLIGMYMVSIMIGTEYQNQFNCLCREDNLQLVLRLHVVHGTQDEHVATLALLMRLAIGIDHMIGLSLQTLHLVFVGKLRMFIGQVFRARCLKLRRFILVGSASNEISILPCKPHDVKMLLSYPANKRVDNQPRMHSRARAFT